MADVAPATEADAASKPPVETTEEVAPVDNAAAELSNMSLAEPPADTRIIRLFIPDIAPTTTVPKLSAHFSQFGEVHHAVIKHPAAGSTERTRSFGFISVVGEAAANVILQTTHIIDGRNVGTPEIAKQRRQEPSFDPSALHSMDSRGNMPNSAIMGWEPNIMGGSAAPLEARKIFVGGLSHQTKESALASYFSQFGPISDVVVMTEGTARRPRGFGFVTFEEPAAVELVIRSRFHPIEGRLVEVKPAVSREQMRQQMAVSPEYGIGGGAGALTAGVGAGPPLGGLLPQMTLNTMGNYPPGAEIPAGTMMPSNTNTYPAGAMPAGLYPPPQTDAVVSGGAYDPTGEQGLNVGGAPPGAWYPGGAGPQGPTMYPPPPMGPHAGPHPGPPHAFYPHSIPAGVPVYVGYGSPEMQYTNMAAAAGGMGGVHGMGGIPPNYTNMPPNANIGGGGGGGVGAQVPSAAPMAAAGGPNLYRTQQMPPQGNINAGQATNPNPNNTAAAGPQQQPAMIPPSLQQQGGAIPTQPMTPAGPHHLAAGPPQGMQMMMMMPTAATTTNAPPPGSPPHGAGGGYAPQGHWVPAGGPPLHPSQMAPHPQPQGPQMMMMVAPQGGVGGGYPTQGGAGGGGGRGMQPPVVPPPQQQPPSNEDAASATGVTNGVTSSLAHAPAPSAAASSASAVASDAPAPAPAASAEAVAAVEEKADAPAPAAEPIS